MDIKDLNKPQLILLALLISFVVSLATGIVTVSLMQQMPKSVPQTINNVIQRTIEKVTTVPAQNQTKTSPFSDVKNVLLGIYPAGTTALPDNKENTNPSDLPPPLGHGVLVSDSGLILVDNTTLTSGEEYSIPLNGVFYQAKLVKKFEGGFSILAIIQKAQSDDKKSDDKIQASARGAIFDKTN